MRLTQSRARGVTIAIVFASYLVCLSYKQAIKWRIMKEQDRVFGKFTARQICQRTRALYQIIEPNSEGLQLSSDPFTMTNGQMFWLVSCKEANDNGAINVLWDARTGALRHLGRLCPQSSTLPYVLTTPAQAVTEAQRWVRNLQPVAQIGTTGLARLRRERDGCWCLIWQRKQDESCLVLDRSGNLLILNCWALQVG